jgi:hypothetical protein
LLKVEEKVNLWRPGDTYALWTCLKRILHADYAGRMLKQYSISFAAERPGSSALQCPWESVCLTKGYQHSLSKEPLRLYKGHRATESVFNVKFRVAFGCGASVANMLRGP